MSSVNLTASGVIYHYASKVSFIKYFRCFQEQVFLNKKIFLCEEVLGQAMRSVSTLSQFIL